MNIRKMPKIGLFAAAVSITALPAVADEDMSYNFVQGAYVDTEIDGNGLDVDGDGLALGVSVELGETLFVTAGYATQDFDFGIDLDQKSLGLGAHFPLASNVDLVGSLSYVDVELDTRFGDADDDGYAAGLGVRAKLTDIFEVEGGINYRDLDDSGDDTSIALGGRYYLTDQLALGAGVDIGDDVTQWNLGVRFEF